jgi:hypothetical protein
MSFAAFQERVEEQLGMKVALERPYNLCDLKTSYGTILADYLDEYDFWGCTDLDLVYGRIRSFITDELLDQHDVIAARPWYLTGFFFLFRNNDHLNQLYRQSRDYKRVYKSPEHFSFIECNKAWQDLRDGVSIFEADTAIESMTEVIRREEQNGLRVHFSEMARESVGATPLKWNEGVLTEGEKEWLLFHFVVHKSHWAFSFPEWAEIPDAFTISRFGVWKGNGQYWAPLRDIRWTTLLRQGGSKVMSKIKRTYS